MFKHKKLVIFSIIILIVFSITILPIKNKDVDVQKDIIKEEKFMLPVGPKGFAIFTVDIANAVKDKVVSENNNG